MSGITHVVIGSDNFSYEHYIQGFYASADYAREAIGKIKPNGSPGLADTFQVMGLADANDLYRRLGESWYFDRMLLDAEQENENRERMVAEAGVRGIETQREVDFGWSNPS